LLLKKFHKLVDIEVNRFKKHLRLLLKFIGDSVISLLVFIKGTYLSVCFFDDQTHYVEQSDFSTLFISQEINLPLQ